MKLQIKQGRRRFSQKQTGCGQRGLQCPHALHIPCSSQFKPAASWRSRRCPQPPRGSPAALTPVPTSRQCLCSPDCLQFGRSLHPGPLPPRSPCGSPEETGELLSRLEQPVPVLAKRRRRPVLDVWEPSTPPRWPSLGKGALHRQEWQRRVRTPVPADGYVDAQTHGDQGCVKQKQPQRRGYPRIHGQSGTFPQSHAQPSQVHYFPWPLVRAYACECSFSSPFC